MAINKSIETPKGVNAEYWKILDRFTNVQLAGYKDQEVRLEDGEPLDIMTLSLPNELKDEIKTLLYNYLKRTPELESGRDC